MSDTISNIIKLTCPRCGKDFVVDKSKIITPCANNKQAGFTMLVLLSLMFDKPPDILCINCLEEVTTNISNNWT